MRAAWLAILLALLLVLGGPPGLAQGANDCGLGVDAGGSAGAASHLRVPVVACAAALEGPFDEDWYVLKALSGGRISAVIVGHGGSLQACLWSPEGVRVTCGLEIAHDTPAAGAWRLQVFPHSGGVGYDASVAVRARLVEGSHLVGHNVKQVPRVSDEAGPGGVPVDGEWVELAGPTRAGEWARSGAIPGLDVRFHGQDGSVLGACVDLGSDPCPIPAGSERAFVARRGVASPEDPRWSFEHLR